MANVTAPSSSSSPPVKVIANYRCKQKQYHGVFWSLKFILALLRHTPLLTTAAAAAPNPSTRSFRDKAEEFEAAADGAGDTFDAAGPLSASQLLSLRQSFTDDDVRQLCLLSLSGYIHRRSPNAPVLVWDTVFAAPSALMQILWPTSHYRGHYTRALAAAHRKRIHHSDLLSQPGYLQEAGLHAEHVFTGAAADADTVATAFTDTQDAFAAAEWCRLIRCYTAFLPDRSHIHELENLPQEVAIGELLRDAVAAVQREGTAAPPATAAAAAPPPPTFALDCVVDVGGGNGFLAAQVAERLQCDGVVIDPFFPAHAIDCCPRVWPDTAHRTHAAVPRRQTLHRTMALFRDVRWRDVVPAAPARTALIAKHLCGSGVDEVLQRLAAQDCLPRILVLAPCCFHRCSLDTHINPGFVAGVLGLESEECFAQLARLTDWNVSVHQRTQEADGQGKHVSQKSVRHLVSCPEGVAAGVEAVVNQGRVQWLQQRGYTVRLVQYVPDVVTPKNKCIVAYRPEA